MSKFSDLMKRFEPTRINLPNLPARLTRSSLNVTNLLSSNSLACGRKFSRFSRQSEKTLSPQASFASLLPI